MVNNTLKSPGYPEDYPNDMECNYKIIIPPGMDLKYVFHVFELEGEDEHGECRYWYY